MIGHFTIETQSTKPAIRQVEVHLLAQPPLRADAEAIADDQHPNQQLRINRGPCPSHCKTVLVLVAVRRVRRTDRSTAISASPAHVVRARTDKTAPPAGRGIPPSSNALRSPGPD